MGNYPKAKINENSCAELNDSRTFPDVLINKGYLTKITAESDEYTTDLYV
jgi:hypothetical protein